MVVQSFLKTYNHPCTCPQSVLYRAVTNTRFVRIFARLHNYLNTLKVFGYTTNDFGAVILVYLVNIYIFL